MNSRQEKISYTVRMMGNASSEDAFKIELKTFKGIFAGFSARYDDEFSDSDWAVLAQINNSFDYADQSYRFFTAETEGTVVALMVMSKAGNTDCWYINDLISKSSGSGTALAVAGIQMAVQDEPENPIRLMSLSDASTAFWLKRGFVLDNPDKKTVKPQPMHRDPPN